MVIPDSDMVSLIWGHITYIFSVHKGVWMMRIRLIYKVVLRDTGTSGWWDSGVGGKNSCGAHGIL